MMARLDREERRAELLRVLISAASVNTTAGTTARPLPRVPIECRC
jgi:hypothetical protein